jgi:hypothetical protein
MAHHDIEHTTKVKAVSRSSSIWLWLSIAAALVAIFGSIGALSSARIYAALTAFFLPQALAQDIGNLALASPAMLITAALAMRACRGSGGAGG